MLVGADAAPQLILPVGDLDGAPARLLKRALDGGDHVRRARCPRWLSSGGNNFTWYCFSSPPTDATSATPEADCSAGLTRLSFSSRSSRRSCMPCAIHERVLEDPAHAAGVRTDGDVRVGRQLRTGWRSVDPRRTAGPPLAGSDPPE